MDENKITDYDIQSKISELSLTQGNNFDKEKFYEDAQKLKDNKTSSLDSLDIGKYTSSQKDDQNKNSLSFTCSRQNGVYSALGSDGTVLQGKDNYDLNLQIAARFKADFDKEGKVGTVGFECKNKDPKEMEDFAKAFINSGVRVSGDIPQDPKFWQQFKNEYLSDPKHSTQEWDKLTANLPGELLGRSQTNEKTNPQSNFLNKTQSQPGQSNSLLSRLMQPTPTENQSQEEQPPKRPQRKPTKSEIKKMRREGFNPRDPEQVARYLHQKEQKHKQERNNTAANMPRRDDDYSR